MWRTLLVLLGVIATLAGVAFLAPRLFQAVDPAPLRSIQSFADTIWWPATGVRVAVYLALGWLIYPGWIDGHRRAALADLNALPAAEMEVEADPTRARIAARLAALAEARRRSYRVFLALLVSDVVLAQLPYFLTTL